MERAGQGLKLSAETPSRASHTRGQRRTLLVSHSVVSDSLWLHGLPARLLRPWHSPGENTGGGCHFLLQGVFLTQRPTPHPLHWQESSLPLSQPGSLAICGGCRVQSWHSHSARVSQTQVQEVPLQADVTMQNPAVAPQMCSDWRSRGG